MDGFANILLNQAASRLLAEDRQVIGKMSARAKQMAKLVDGLLDLSRLGRHSLSKGPVDLGALVAEVLEGLAHEHEGRKLEICVGDLPKGDCDASLLKSVFVNLISNAIKFTAGKEAAVVEIGCLEQNGEAVFFVRDNGAGCDMDYVHKVFLASERLHPRDEFEGTGLGLAIVQKIIQRHGGRIWAEAEVAKGAAFYFTLA